MHNFKKTIISVLSVIGIITVFSVVLSFFVPHNEMLQRKQLAGNLDFLVVGASQAQRAFATDVLDAELNCNSYNLSIGSMTMSDRYIMLEKEINRNPVDVVVLEISYNAMARANLNNAADGNYHMITRMETFSESLDYLFRHTPFSNWEYVYARSMLEAIENLISNTKQEDTGKGFKGLSSKDYSLNDEEIVPTYHSLQADFGYDNAETLSTLHDIADLCKAHGARLMLVVVPVGDCVIWQYDNLDEFNFWMKEICAEESIEYYDFNLARNRYDLYSDDLSYSSSADHMSESGAYAFTYTFSDVMNKVNSGEDISALFYTSYYDLIVDSPYMDYYLSNSEKE